MFSLVNIKSAAARQSDAIYAASIQDFYENDEGMKLYIVYEHYAVLICCDQY